MLLRTSVRQWVWIQTKHLTGNVAETIVNKFKIILQQPRSCLQYHGIVKWLSFATYAHTKVIRAQSSNCIVLTGLAWSHVPDKFMDNNLSVWPSRHFRDGLNAILVPRRCRGHFWPVIVLHVGRVRRLDEQARESWLDYYNCSGLGHCTSVWQWIPWWAGDIAVALRLTQYTPTLHNNNKDHCTWQ